MTLFVEQLNCIYAKGALFGITSSFTLYLFVMYFVMYVIFMQTSENSSFDQSAYSGRDCPAPSPQQTRTHQHGHRRRTGKEGHS